MSTQHLKAGDEFPARKEGLLRIYGMRYCPFDHRTQLVLAQKEIPHEVVFVNLKQKPEWFTSRNPVGTVPTIEFPDGKILWESAILNDYLDEAYPEKKLNPEDPYEKARQRILVERWSKVQSLLYQSFREPGKLDEIKSDLKKNFKIFENSLADTYFGGKTPSTSDFNMWPIMERVLSADVTGYSKLLDDNFSEEFPKLKKWSDAMMELPSVKKHYIDPERHVKFIKSYMSGAPEYD